MPKVQSDKKLEGVRSSLPNLNEKKAFDSGIVSRADMSSVESRTDENVSHLFVTRNEARSHRKAKDDDPLNMKSRNQGK